MDGRPSKKGQDCQLPKLMVEEKSLDKIVSALGINKKTALDWRHKILSSLDMDNRDDFTGITESDESFFLRSEKGMEVKDRKPRKRCGKSSKRGISKDQVAVIATQDRRSGLDLSVATLGRIGKADIASAIGKRIKSAARYCAAIGVSTFAVTNLYSPKTITLYYEKTF